MIKETKCFIYWIEIYPADTVIHPFQRLGPGLYRSLMVMKQSTFFQEVAPEMWAAF